MRILILMRHAKAVRPHEADSDKARGLTGRGRRDSAAAGAAMEDAGLKPALALVSTAQRTRETAEHGLQNFALETRYEEALYHAAPEGIWDAFSASDAESVVIVGHNPGIGELVTMLVHQAHDGSKLAREFSGHFPTAAFAAFEVKGDLMRAAGPRLIAAWKPVRDRDD
ncbi:MAG TPA: histidine phosphatase family protein [Vitreimonas sp.]|uniref:SixA phosphatase family protein n=1 Tax=Vitreimonas sp. TaxID=3069702 RepID=UPI002D41020E|nr:histidine phosphatase family protein [Vitreimonas sp.]HYD89445.1 histidine phosphatase family protein [Vitreimonas sp.]